MELDDAERDALNAWKDARFDAWNKVTEGVHVIRCPGGWICTSGGALMVFIPDAECA